MEIKYVLTEEDYVHFNMYHIKNSEAAMKMLNLQRYLTPIFFIIVSILLSQVSEIPLPISLSVFLVIGILWYIYYPKYYERFLVKQVKKMFSEGKNDGLLGEHILTLSEEGLVETTSNGETRASWTSIKNFKEDKDYYFLYNSSISAYIIPKRGIEQLDDVSNTIRANLVYSKEI